jgi:hypothetical protein
VTDVATSGGAVTEVAASGAANSAATEAKHGSLVPATIGLVSTLLFAGLGIAILNRPAKKTFTVSATCQSVRIAQSAALSLGHDAAAVQLRGFAGKIDHIDAAKSGDRSVAVSNNSVSLEPDASNPTDAPPSLRWRVERLSGEVAVSAKDFVLLRATGDNALEIEVGAGSRIAMHAGAVGLEAARFRGELPTTVSNAHALVDGTFHVVEHPPAGDPSVRIQWPSTTTEPRSIDPPSGGKLAGAQTEIHATACGGQTIRIGSGDAAGTRGDDANLLLRVDRFAFERLSFEPTSASAKRSGGVRFRVGGDATAIYEDDRQLVPTILAELLKSEPYQLGIVGACAIFVVFTGATIFKRSLDVFAKRMIPD